MEQLRAAVVGVGMIGSLHARIYAEYPASTLVAVADANVERARQVGAELGVPWYPDHRALLAAESVDLLSIATPEQVRFDQAVDASRRVKALLLEKPLAPTFDEARRLVEAVEAAGIPATVNFTLRSDPRYQRARAAMLDGTVGEPVTLFARRRGTSLGAEIYGPWTDLLISTAIHDIDAMIWVNGARVARVHAEAVVKRSAMWGKEDAVMALLRFENGAVGSLETSWVLPTTVPALLDASFQLVGTKGGVFIDGANHGLSVVSSERYSEPDLTHWPVGPRGVDGDLRAHIVGFVDDVLTGAVPSVSLRDALYAQEVVAALKASIRSGQPVMLPFDGPE